MHLAFLSFPVAEVFEPLFPLSLRDHSRPAALEVRFLLSASTAPWDGHHTILQDGGVPETPNQHAAPFSRSPLCGPEKKKQSPRGRQLELPPPAPDRAVWQNLTLRGSLARSWDSQSLWMRLPAAQRDNL